MAQDVTDEFAKPYTIVGHLNAHPGDGVYDRGGARFTSPRVRRFHRQNRAQSSLPADRCCADRHDRLLHRALEPSRSSARNCTHSVTITSASAPSAQA